MSTEFTWADVFALCTQFMALSLVSVGGGLAVIPDTHRFLVLENHWLTDAQFSASVALAQVAPGPNVLFVSLMGWYVGLDGLGMAWAPVLALACLLCMIGPSSLLTLHANRWVQRNRDLGVVKAFHMGLAPVVLALLLSSAWYIFPLRSASWQAAPAIILWLASLAVLARTKLNLMFVLALGAILGALGLV